MRPQVAMVWLSPSVQLTLSPLVQAVVVLVPVVQLPYRVHRNLKWNRHRNQQDLCPSKISSRWRHRWWPVVNAISVRNAVDTIRISIPVASITSALPACRQRGWWSAILHLLRNVGRKLAISSACWRRIAPPVFVLTPNADLPPLMTGFVANNLQNLTPRSHWLWKCFLASSASRSFH